MLFANQLTIDIGARTLVRDVSLRLAAGDRVALVGPNGIGKTTLMSTLVGLREPTKGKVELVTGTTVGYLEQDIEGLRGRILDLVIQVHPAYAATHGKDLHLDSDAQHLFAVHAGYEAESFSRKVLSGLGVRDGDALIEELSGGQAVRVALARLLVSQPNVLLLDEPTNHLDLDAVDWLTSYLRSIPGALMLISHDRDLINAVATTVIEIHEQRLDVYAGDFEAFVAQREQRAAIADQASKNQQRRLKQQHRFIERFRYKQSKATQVQSRIKMLAREELIAPQRRAERRMKLGFPSVPRSSQLAIHLDGVDFSYGVESIYENVNLEIERGQKVLLTGPNGAGKTTMLKLFVGELKPTAGHRRLGSNVSIGYFAQRSLDALDGSLRVIQEIQRSIPPNANIKPRNLLGSFLFSGDDVDKPVSVLSGGEKTRLALAKLLTEPHNVLCLDEPTNHLDMVSRDALEEALDSYEGAVILITHDRHLVRSVIDVVVEVGGGGATRHLGDYETYLWRKAGEPESPDSSAVAKKVDDAKSKRKESANARAKTAVPRKKISSIEAELDKLHVKLKELELQLSDPEFWSLGGDATAQAMKTHADLKAKTKTLEAEWDTLVT